MKSKEGRDVLHCSFHRAEKEGWELGEGGWERPGASCVGHLVGDLDLVTV